MMFNPIGSGLLTSTLGSAQSAFHPVHSPVCRHQSPTLSQSSASSPQAVQGPLASPVESNSLNHQRTPSGGGTPQPTRTLMTLHPLTPTSADGACSATTSPNLFSPTPKLSPPSSSEGQSLGVCQICSDRATGKHYGANSCDGCKGFFRRTVRKDQHYSCRFSRSCVIDKDKRNTCRFCRFKKCINAGMRRDAVQNERDRISVKRQRSQSPAAEQQQQPVTTHSHLSLIQQAENLYAHLRASVITTSSLPSPNESAGLTNAPRLATMNDLADAIKQQLLLLVEWAKSLPPFYDLSLDDQVTLLRAYAAEHLLLGVARRSLPYKDVLLLSNDACIPRSHSSEIHDVNRVVFRILDELVEPMRDLQLDDTEYGCLKTLLFFNPSSMGLSDRQKVKETRQSFLEAFNEYVTRKESTDKVRFGNLLLLLPPLQAMSQQFIEDLQLATLFGLTTFDKLLEELLLAAAEPQYFSVSGPFMADGFVKDSINAVASKMSNLSNIIGSAGQLSPTQCITTVSYSSEMDKKLNRNGSDSY